MLDRIGNRQVGESRATLLTYRAVLDVEPNMVKATGVCRVGRVEATFGGKYTKVTHNRIVMQRKDGKLIGRDARHCICIRLKVGAVK